MQYHLDLLVFICRCVCVIRVQQSNASSHRLNGIEANPHLENHADCHRNQINRKKIEKDLTKRKIFITKMNIIEKESTKKRRRLA